jgi:probable HAF family extracellular repeat protein
MFSPLPDHFISSFGFRTVVRIGAFLSVGVASGAELPRYSVAELPAEAKQSVHTFGMSDAGIVSGAIGVPDFMNPAYLPFTGPPAGPLNVQNELGFQYAFPQAMNSLGGIAGQGYFLEGQEWRPTLFRKTHDGPMVEIGHFDGASGGTYAMNDAGEVVGYWTISQPPMLLGRAFYFSDATGMVNLGTLGGYQSFAVDINSSGLIAGYSNDAQQRNRAFVWQDGELVDLGTLGGPYSFAWFVNDAGQVFGRSDTETNDPIWFVWDAINGMREFRPAGGGTILNLFQIDAAGNVGGLYRMTDGTNVVFRHTSDGIVDIANIGSENLGTVVAMNAAGEILSLRSETSYEFFPTYFSPAGGLQRIDLVDFGLSWAVTNVVAVNASGQLLVTGNENGLERGAVLTPPPPCMGDIDDDGAVGLSDLALLLSAFGCEQDNGCVGNLDGDRDTDLTDLAILLGRFGSACE